MKIDFLTKREMIVLNLLDDYTVSETSRKLGISRTRVGQYKQKIKFKIAYRLAKKPQISVQLFNALSQANINNITEAKKLSDYQLLTIRNVGKKRLRELRSYRGVGLKTSLSFKGFSY